MWRVQGHGYADFSTGDRHADLPSGLTRAEWTTPIAGWRTTTGESMPTAAKAIDTFPMLKIG